jgi:GT2 family glycosyltransferase
MRDPTRLDSVGDWLTWSGMLYHQGYLQPDEGLDSPFPIFSAKGACMLFRASLLRRIGAFDEAYWAYFEETDLCWRVWLAGYRVYFVPSARVLHLLAGTSRQVDTYAITFHSFKNRIHSMLKNFGAVYLWRVLPVHLAICVGLVGGYALRGHWRKARAIWSALWWNLRHARHTWRQRHRVQREIRTVTDRELMRFAMAPVSLRYLWDLYREYERV